MMQTLSHEYFMEYALKEAKEASNKGEVPIGCIIVSDNNIIAKSHNLVESLRDTTAHAEILAITSASNYLNSKYLNDCKMYITLEPCTMCCGALYWAQIGEVIFATSDERRGGISKGIHIHPKTKIIPNVLSHRAHFMIQEFFKTRR